MQEAIHGAIWQMLRHLHISVLHIIAVTHDVLGGCNKIPLRNVKRFRRSLYTCFEPETTAAVLLKMKKKKRRLTWSVEHDQGVFLLFQRFPEIFSSQVAHAGRHLLPRLLWGRWGLGTEKKRERACD